MLKEISYKKALLFMMPLSFIIYFIFTLNFTKDQSLGMLILIVIFAFTQFFFQRYNLIYTIKTIIAFYIFAIISSLLISFSYMYTNWELLIFASLVQVYIFMQLIGRTSLLSNESLENMCNTEGPVCCQKWYKKIL